MAVTSASPNAPVRLNGVSLEQFAGVRAAIAEGIPLREVLAQEEIAEASWSDADLAWMQTIAESVALQIELIQKTGVAADCLTRTTEPLENDAAAWSGLLGALATADEPDAILQKLGITATDMGRLGRHWKRKTAADPDLVKQLTDLAPTAKPPERVTVGATTLRPFPWTPQRAKRADAPPVARAALPVAEVPIAAAPPQVQRATYQLQEQQSGPAAPAAAFPQPSYLLAGAPPAAPPPLQSPPARPRAPVESGTAHVDPNAIAAGIALAAARTAKAANAPLPPSETKPEVPSQNAPPKPRFGTGTEAVDTKAVEAGLALAAARAGKPPSKLSALAGTVAMPDLPAESPAVPFKPQADAAAPPAAKPAPERIPTGTVLASDAPAGAATPFQSNAPSAPVPPAPREMTLQAYAYVMACVKNAAPTELPSVLQRLNLSPDELERLQAHWNARMRGDMAAATQYGFLRAEALAKLRAKPGGQ